MKLAEQNLYVYICVLNALHEPVTIHTAFSSYTPLTG